MAGCFDCKYHLSKYSKNVVIPYCKKGEIKNFKKFWNSVGFENINPVDLDCCDILIIPKK